MQNIIIVGAGRFGRELCCWIEHLRDTPGISIRGFLDDTRSAATQLNDNYPYPLLGPISTYAIEENDVFIISIADPVNKLRIAAALQARGASFFTLIHPTAVLARTTRIGIGAIICPFAMLSADSVVGDFVTINSYASVGHDAILGNGATLSAHVDITGGVQVEPAAFFGSGASVLPQLRIGARATVGAGAVVMRHVDADTTVYAMPAKKL